MIKKEYKKLNIISPIKDCNEINFTTNNISMETYSYNNSCLIINSRNINNKKLENNKSEYIKKPKINTKFTNNKKNNNINEQYNNYNNLSTKKYIKSLNLIYNTQIEAINTQFSNYKKYNNKKKYVYGFIVNNPNYINGINSKRLGKEKYINNSNVYFSPTLLNKKNIMTQYKTDQKKRNFSSINIQTNNNINTYKIQLDKISEIIINKIYFYKKYFFKKILDYNKINYSIKNIDKYNDYIICHENNIYIHNKKKQIDIDIKNSNSSLIKEKNSLEYRINILIKENSNLQKIIKQCKTLEDKYNEIIIQNETLNRIHKELIKRYNALSKELEDIKNDKKIYEQILKEKNYKNNNLYQQIGIMSKIINIKDKIKNINDENTNKNKKINSKTPNINKETNTNNNDNNLNKQQSKFISKENRSKYLKNILRIKIDKIKQNMHQNFSKFYYNGIFLKMTGKLTHLNDKENNKENENNVGENNAIIDKDNNINNKKNMEKINEEEKKEKENNEYKKRIDKARNLRRILQKKEKEKKELLKINFYKFYKNGIINKFRQENKRKTLQASSMMTNRIAQKLILQKKNIELEPKEKKDKDELKKKIALQKIVFKIDRKNMKILKNVFQRFYLKTKLESVQDLIKNDNNGKKKKKKKKKVKKKDSNIIVEEDNVNNKKEEKVNDNTTKVEEINNNTNKKES